MTATRYVYRATVRNTGAKTMVAFAWEYRFLDPVTREEIGKHSLYSKIESPAKHDR
ncbi:MAG TPA: hypothetical protein VJ023_16040 [Pyrinomonadaceae bacterium]|nr:hypothetical protein [Pyrinomonadaceae bacterium]